MVDNVNFLSPIGFKLVVDRTPNTEYYCTAVSIPSVLIGETPFQTATRTVSVYADKLNFDFLNIRMIIDEDLSNYQEIYNWINEIVYTEDTEMRNKASDITVAVLSSHNNVVKYFRFTGAFPISIGALDFDAGSTDVEYISTEVQFKFTDMEVVEAS
jgi:hypothetical protein